MNPNAAFREAYRQQVLYNRGIIGPMNGKEELRRSRFFIETMEEFIRGSETAEVKELEAKARGLSDEAKDEFWQWHYPIHWEDIFGVRIRSAFCAQLCSQIEATLGDIAHRVEVIERCEVELKHLKGTALEGAKRYFSAFGKFDGPPDALWEQMGFVFRIRNVHVHQQGYASDLSKQTQFAAFLAGLPNVSTQNDFIELKEGSCAALLEMADRFHDAVLSEYESYRQRAVALEKVVSPASL
jgi:hypothetical protein